MAYFPNGTAVEVLTVQCDECLHGLDAEVLCPIISIQMYYNYDQLDAGNEDLKEALNMLINEGGACQMKKLLNKFSLSLTDPKEDMSELEIWEAQRKESGT